LLLYDDGLVLAESRDDLQIQVQVALHQFGWRQCHPPVRRNAREVRTAQHFEVT
jgi:hypothetical protein